MFICFDRVTEHDRWTDRQTDTARPHMPHLCTASCGKIREPSGRHTQLKAILPCSYVVGGSKYLTGYCRSKINKYSIATYLVLLHSMTSTKLYINSIFVIDDATNTRHRTIYQTFFFIQCSLLYLVRQRARIGKKTHVVNRKVTTTWHSVNWQLHGSPKKWRTFFW